MGNYTTLNEQVDRLRSLMQIKPINEGSTDQLQGEMTESLGSNMMGLAKRLLNIRTPDEKKAEVLRYIESGENPNVTKAYNQFKQTNPMKAQKYIEFYMTYPSGYPKWDGTKFIEQVETSFLQEKEVTPPPYKSEPHSLNPHPEHGDDGW